MLWTMNRTWRRCLERTAKFYRIIFENAAKVLKERAMMAFEMGYNQKEALSEEAKKYFPNARIEVLKDMSGKNRMLFVYLNMEH